MVRSKRRVKVLSSLVHGGTQSHRGSWAGFVGLRYHRLYLIMWPAVDSAYDSFSISGLPHAQPAPKSPPPSGTVESIYEGCHTVKPRGRRVTRVEGASGPRLSKHNHFLYFEHTQGLKDGLPVPDCQSKCHCKLGSLMASDCQRLWGESTEENSSSSWQAGLLTNYLFF